MVIHDESIRTPEDFARCASFHGHICPGLVYGYRVAKEALRLLGTPRAPDEEIVAICENDSCAVDAIQVLLGATAGKGNLIIRNYGKNAYTILSRSRRQAYRFARKDYYAYRGEAGGDFSRMEAAAAAGTASDDDRRHLRILKVQDLLQRPFEEIFTAAEVPFEEPGYAPLERSVPCAACGDMTMATKMVLSAGGGKICIPCSQNG